MWLAEWGREKLSLCMVEIRRYDECERERERESAREKKRKREKESRLRESDKKEKARLWEGEFGIWGEWEGMTRIWRGGRRERARESLSGYKWKAKRDKRKKIECEILEGEEEKDFKRELKRAERESKAGFPKTTNKLRWSRDEEKEFQREKKSSWKKRRKASKKERTRAI